MSQALTESLEANLTAQYATAVQALGELGFAYGTIRARVTPLPELLESLSDGQTTILEERRAAGLTDSLNIAPLIQHTGLIGTDKRPGLITRFNQQQVGELRPTDTYSLKGLMRYFTNLEIGDKDPLHDNGAEGRWPVAIVFEDTADSPFVEPSYYGMAQSVGVVHETGGYYHNGRLPRTQHALDREIEQAAVAGYVLKGASLAQVVARVAQIRNQERAAGRQSLINREGSVAVADFRGSGNVGLLHYPWIHRAAEVDVVVPVIENEYDRLNMRTTAEVFTAVSSVTGVLRVMPIEPK